MSCDFEYKLSVVVLVYNTEYYLEECLDSLVNQTLDGIEIICVNDESTDGSLNILKKYAREYDNIKIINQKNQGGAIAGNNGLKVAKGEYVTLMDSDDIVVLDAYEKMYKKAKETNSDIVSGKPYVYSNNVLLNLVGSRHDLWDEERVINVKKDLEIYYDVFYWNKIYRRTFLEENKIYMIPGKIYADAPLIFEAYLKANKITLIPDFVYYWRSRQANSSVTRNTRDLNNLKDRFDNYYVLKDYFDDGELFNKVIKIYLERFFFPIKGIFTNSLYKKTYLKGLYDILDDIENVYDNEYISIVYNLCAYFILNKQIDTLEEFLLNYSTVKNIFIEKDKIYWDLKYFRNSKYNIPDKLFEIKNIHHNFININDMEVDSDYIYLNNISIPHNLKIDEAKIIFEGMTRKYGSKDKNNYQFDLEIIGINKFNAKVPIKKIDNINSYDVFLEFNYNGKKEDFRVNKKNFTKEIDESDINKNMNTLVLFTKCNSLSFLNVDIKEIFEINYMEDGLKIIPKKVGDANYKISINHKWVSERVYFIKSVDNEIESNIEFELKWKLSLDENILYSLDLELYNQSFELKSDYFTNFEDKIIKYDNFKIKIFEGNNKIFIIKTN